MDNLEFAHRLIQVADEYYFTAEEEWKSAVELKPEDDDSLNEFFRYVRSALIYYTRAYLVLEMIETDDEQGLEELLDVASESLPTLTELLEKNHGGEVLNVENSTEYSRIFAVAEAIRTLLLHQSSQLAATLHKRFVTTD